MCSAAFLRPSGRDCRLSLVVIPGNIAFLNQFFSVQLMVANVAPDGTPLAGRDVKGEIFLPTGLDRVPSTVAENGVELG